MCKKIELTCIMCPKGCALTIYKENNKLIIEGNQCKKGFEYATRELTNPQRILTSTVKLKTEDIINRIAVYSKDFVAKEKLIPLCRKLKDVEVEAPIKTGEIVCTIDGISFISSSTIGKNNVK